MRLARCFAFVLAAGITLPLGGCDALFGDRIRVDKSQSGSTVAAKAGDHIEITLGTVGPGQYDTPAVSSACVRYLGESSPGPPTPAGVRQLFRFEAVKAGRADISIPHSGGFPDGPQTPAFTLTILVS